MAPSLALVFEKELRHRHSRAPEATTVRVGLGEATVFQVPRYRKGQKSGGIGTVLVNLKAGVGGWTPLKGKHGTCS